MKVLIIVTVLAMATSAIAVPLSRQAKAQALLAAMQDSAELQGLGDFFRMVKDGIIRHGPKVLDVANRYVNGGGEENEIELLAAMQDNAEMETILTDIRAAVVKYAPNVDLVIKLDDDGLDALDVGTTRRDLLNSLEGSLNGELKAIENIEDQTEELMNDIEKKEKVFNTPPKVFGNITNINPKWRNNLKKKLNIMNKKCDLLSNLAIAKKNALNPLKNVIKYLREGLH